VRSLQAVFDLKSDIAGPRENWRDIDLCRIEQTYPGIEATKGKSGKSKSSFTKQRCSLGGHRDINGKKDAFAPSEDPESLYDIGQVQSAEPVQTHQPKYRFQQIFTVH
jgi:hypothetical protein